MNTFKIGYKTMFWFTALILFAGITFGCWKPGPLEGHVKITEQTTFFMEDTSANPIPFKVAVYKTEFMEGPAYLVTYNYLDISDDSTVCAVGGIWGSEIDYTTAYFKWTNDTTVTIILFNTDGMQEEFKVFGVPSSGGVGIEILEE
jgi:hypothetical protein